MVHDVFMLYVGLEPEGVCSLAPAYFTVETFSAGRGEITAQVVNADGQAEEVMQLTDNFKVNYVYIVYWQINALLLPFNDIYGIHKDKLQFTTLFHTALALQRLLPSAKWTQHRGTGVSVSISQWLSLRLPQNKSGSIDAACKRSS